MNLRYKTNITGKNLQKVFVISFNTGIRLPKYGFKLITEQILKVKRSANRSIWECSTTLPRHSSLREATADSGAVLGPRLVQVPTWGLETEPPRTRYQMIRRLSCRCLWQGQLPLQSGMQLQCQ